MAIARALVNDPAIILADEPTGNLDSRSSVEIMDLLHQLHSQGVTVVMVTHEQDIAHHAQRVICVRDGKVVSEGRDGGSPCLEQQPAVQPVTQHWRLAMKWHKIFRIAWEGLALNKVRSFLTTLGVIIGVASVIIMLAISAGTEAAIAEQINSLGANLLIGSPMRVSGAGRTLLLDDAYAIAEQVVGITGVSAEQSRAAQLVKANGVTLGTRSPS